MTDKLPPPEPNHSTLRNDYQTLTHNYNESVQAFALRRREIGELNALATWALRATPTGWALVRDGRLRLTNRAFDVLDRGSVMGPRWHRVDSAGAEVDDVGRSLRAIVLEQAQRLLAGDPASARERFVRGEQVVEVKLERPTTEGVTGNVVMGLVSDVTEVARAEAQIAAMQARLVEKERAGVFGELAIGIAHDLGNLVGALRARMAALEAELPAASGPAEPLKALNVIVQAQASLVKKLKSLARPRPDTPTPVDLRADVVEPAVQMVESWLRMRDRKRPVWIRIDGSLAELPAVYGLPDELINVLINLFVNARDAMPEGGVVHVRSLNAGASVLLLIEDQGTGIADADLPRIFEPFFSTKGSAGMGMGLAMAATVMRRLGGSITARNRPEGGASFELCFVPVRPTADEPEHNRQSAP